jgi:hypothetical protein
MSFIAHNHEDLIGQVIGTGHCVPMVREATGAPHTSEWRRGSLVKGLKLARGTAIATFDPSGTYGNHTDGRSHCAILEAETDAGLEVIDQWQGRPTGRRVIRFKRGTGQPCDDADQYHVIEVG